MTGIIESDVVAGRRSAGENVRLPTARRRVGSPRWVPYLPYLLPGLVGFALIILYPLLTNVWISFHSWRGGLSPMNWIGIDNYIALFQDAAFWTSFRNSLAMIVAIVVVPTLLGLLLAALLFDFLGRKFGPRVASFLRATFYLPQILPVAVAGMLWNWILNAQTGALNEMLRSMGITNPPNWLGSTSLALPSVMLMLIWSSIGYPVVIFMAALQRVDPELYEAAELDGAGWGRRFQAITLPQIQPETFVVVLTCTIAALKVFAPIFVLTRGGPENSTLVPSYYAFQNFFVTSRVGYGAAISTVLTIVIIAVAGVILSLQHRAERREEMGL